MERADFFSDERHIAIDVRAVGQSSHFGANAPLARRNADTHSPAGDVHGGLFGFEFWTNALGEPSVPPR